MGMMMENEALSFVSNNSGRFNPVSEKRLSRVVQLDQSNAFRLREMESELQQYRYRLEKMVEERTEMLSRRIAILESCNAQLCDSYGQMRMQYFALLDQAQPELSSSVPVSNAVEHQADIN